TVLLTTHYMEEADQLCDRVAIIDHGKIVALDSPNALKRTIRAEEIVRLDIGIAGDGDGAAIVDRLSRAGTVARSERHNGTLSLTVPCASARELVPAAFDPAHAAGAGVVRGARRNDRVRRVRVHRLRDVHVALVGALGPGHVAPARADPGKPRGDDAHAGLAAHPFVRARHVRDPEHAVHLRRHV